MFARILTFSLAHRWTVLLGVLVLIAAGCWVVYTIPVDAFPDLTNNQVVIVTEAPSMPPTEVEQLVTYPVERTLMGMPKQQEVRSLSKLGLSMVTVVFDDTVPTYFARQLVNERLQQVVTSLPAGIQPVLSPPSTAFGRRSRPSLPPRSPSARPRRSAKWRPPCPPTRSAPRPWIPYAPS